MIQDRAKSAIFYHGPDLRKDVVLIHDNREGHKGEPMAVIRRTKFYGKHKDEVRKIVLSKEDMDVLIEFWIRESGLFVDEIKEESR